MAFTNERKVAIITGGGTCSRHPDHSHNMTNHHPSTASGMGFAVAKALCARGWHVAILDIQPGPGEQAATALGDTATFIEADVTSYESQLAAFERVFAAHGRVDFVHANAGIAGPATFYEHWAPPARWPPPPPPLAEQAVMETGVIHSVYLGMHFMRRNVLPVQGGCITVTASSASIYGMPLVPVYTAAKHGALGLVRAASQVLCAEGIRVNCICPGAVRTNLHSEALWAQVDTDHFTSLDDIAATVLALLDDPTSAGRAVEIGGGGGALFVREQPAFSSAATEAVYGQVVASLRANPGLARAEQ